MMCQEKQERAFGNFSCRGAAIFESCVVRFHLSPAPNTGALAQPNPLVTAETLIRRTCTRGESLSVLAAAVGHEYCMTLVLPSGDAPLIEVLVTLASTSCTVGNYRVADLLSRSLPSRIAWGTLRQYFAIGSFRRIFSPVIADHARGNNWHHANFFCVHPQWCFISQQVFGDDHLSPILSGAASCLMVLPSPTCLGSRTRSRLSRSVCTESLVNLLVIVDHSAFCSADQYVWTESVAGRRERVTIILFAPQCCSTLYCGF